ncbi:methyltransferase domain-containing protein [Micromonospora sp. DT47]|uniref:class I SAM-dependent methyltransferase n=1 Tax=Micromonospora sp. DT47 TaxID=3393431 RepID=UPI003CF2E624
MTSANQDRWAQWILRRRDAGDPGVRAHGASLLAAYRDGVLDRAEVAAGDVLLDVGTGNGLLGFAALERVGPGGQVIFSDISTDLLDECRLRAAAGGLLDRSRFVHASADDLRGVQDQSVDIVTTRSVLIYVERKQAAFAKFFRVLRPSGRLSIFEPINSFGVTEAGPILFGLDMTPIADLAAKLRRAYESVPQAENPMLSFDERDLLRWARGAGFASVELDYRAEVEVPYPLPTTDWEVLKKTAPNPLAPTYEEALAQMLTDQERYRFENHVRAVLAAGTLAHNTLATTFLRAIRP